MVTRSAMRLDLVELVRDVQHRHAVGGEAPHELEQHLGLAAGEHVGRLVHAQHPNVARDGLGDLDHLRLRHRELSHAAVDVDVGPERREQLARRLALELPVDDAEAVPLVAPRRRSPRR
jgi:hypothetical protein